MSKKKQKKQNNRAHSGPPFLPDEVLSKFVDCPKCGASLQPDFWREFDAPFGPIELKPRDGQRMFAVQQTFTLTCKCGGKVEFPLDPKMLEHPVYFFGDDADRHLYGYYLHSYTLIGGTSGPVRDMCDDLEALKQKYIPDIDPRAWRIHAKDMVSGKHRVRNAIYKRFTRESILDFFEECAYILLKRDKYTWNMHITAPAKEGIKRERGKIEKMVKATAHKALLSQCIYQATKQNLNPQFTLDASNKIKAFPHIESWSFDTHNESQFYLGFELLSHGNSIAAPELVKPGSHPCLELADVHAFFAANWMFKTSKGEPGLMDINKFGEFKYFMIRDGNRCDYHSGTEIPRHYFPSERMK